MSIIHSTWIYALIVLLVMVEGPISILLSAGISATGLLNPLGVFCAATIGNFTADILWYVLGYFGNIDWLLRLPKFMGIDSQKLNRLNRLVNMHAVKLLIFAKLTNGLIVPVLVATGLARVSMRRWFPIIVVANLLTSAVFVFIGYYMILSLKQIEQGVWFLAIIGTLVLVLVSIIFVKRVFNRKDIVTELENLKK